MLVDQRQESLVGERNGIDKLDDLGFDAYHSRHSSIVESDKNAFHASDLVIVQLPTEVEKTDLMNDSERRLVCD